MNIKKKILIPLTSIAMLMTACGPKGPSYPVVTFHQERAEDVKITITPELTEDEFYNQIPDFVYDPINEPEVWFEGEWKDLPEFEDIKTSMTINAEFVAQEFNAHFKKTESGTGDEIRVPYTFADYKVDPNHLDDEPEVPAKLDNWYTGTWANYTLDCRDITILPQYAKKTFTATFKDEDGEKVGTKTYDIDTYNARDDHKFAPEDEPAVPAKAENPNWFDSAWGEYVLDDQDISISPEYTEKTFVASFMKEDETVSATKEFNFTTYNARDDHKFAPADEPAVPTKNGNWYAGSWADYTLAPENISIAPVYVKNTFNCTFKNGEETVATKTFDIDTYNARDDHRFAPADEPLTPTEAGYDFSWNYVLTDSNVTATLEKTLHKYYIKLYEDADKQNLVGTVSYDTTVATFADIANVPAVPTHTGYDGSWGSPELTYSDTAMEVVAQYTAKQYKITYPDASTQTVTYNSSYTLDKKPTDTEAYEPYFNWVTPEGATIAQTGTWSIASDVTVSPKFVEISFEDKKMPSFMSGLAAPVLSFSYDETDAVDGNVSLKGKFGSYGGGIKMEDSYYAAAFSDSDVKSIDFYVRCDVETNNFRYRYWTDATTHDKSHRGADCYEMNKTGYGLANRWKRFSLTREIFEKATVTNFGLESLFYVEGNQADFQNKFIWIDYIKVNKVGIDKVIGFENGIVMQKDGNSKKYGAYLNAFDESEMVFCNKDTGVDVAIEVNYNKKYVSEGVASVSFEHTANKYLAFFVKQSFVSGMDDNDLFAFDAIADWQWLGGSSVMDGKNTATGKSIGTDSWVHFEFTKAQLSDGRFLILNGGSQSGGHIFFDNIHVIQVA